MYQVYHSLISAPLWVSSAAYIRQNYRKEKVFEALGFFYSGQGLGLLLGALIGAFLIERIGFSIIYALSIAFSIAFVISLFLPRKNRKSMLKGLRDSIMKDGIVVKEIKDSLKNKLFRDSAVFIFLFFFSTFFLVMVIPLFLRELNATYYTIAIVYSFFYAPMVFESYFARIKHKKRTLVLSLFLMSLVFLALYFIENMYIIFSLAFIVGILFAMMTPIIQGRISTFIPRKDVGEFSGVEAAVTNLARGLSFLVAGFVSDIYGLNTMFLIGFVILFTLSWLVYQGKLLPLRY